MQILFLKCRDLCHYFRLHVTMSAPAIINYSMRQVVKLVLGILFGQ